MDANAKVIKIIDKCILFNGLSSSERLRALDSLDGVIRTIKAHSAYIRTGEQVLITGIVLEGSLNSCIIDPNGNLSLMDKLKPGYLIGFDIACTGTGISPYDFYAPEDAVIIEFDFDRIKKPGYIDRQIREKMLWNLILYLSNNNIRFQYKIEVLSCSSIRDKVMNYLITRSKKLNSREFDIPFDREELAGYLCVNRSALSHELSLMRQDGLINFRKNHFKLLIDEY